MKSKFKSRKFILAVFFSICIVGMTALGVISGEVFLAGMGTILGLYNAANSGVKYIHSKKSDNEDKTEE